MKKDSYLLWLIILFALLTLLLYEPFAGKGGDECFYLSYLTSILYDGDLLFYNDLLSSNNPYFISLGMASRITETGFVANPYAPGSALLAFPFFLLGTLAEAVSSGSLQLPPQDKYAFFILYFASFSAVFYTLLGLYLLFRLLTLRFPGQVAFWSLLALFITSPLIMYTLKKGFMSHSYSFFAVALFLYLCLGERRWSPLWHAFLIGMGAGLVSLARWQDAVLLIFPLFFFLTQIQKEIGKHKSPLLRLSLLAFAGFIPFFLLQIILWRIIYGKFLLLPQGEGFFRPLQPYLFKFLFSGWNGLFSTSPFLLIAFIGFFRLFRQLPCFSLSLLLPVILHIYICSANVDWFGGMSFGARRFCSALPFLSFGFAALFDALHKRLSSFKRLSFNSFLGVILFIHLLFVIFSHRGAFTYYFFPYQLWLWQEVILRLLLHPLWTLADSTWLQFLILGRNNSLALLLFLMLPSFFFYLLLRATQRFPFFRATLIISIYLIVLFTAGWAYFRHREQYEPGLLLLQALKQEKTAPLKDNLTLLTQAMQKDPANCLIKFKYLVTRLSLGESEETLAEELKEFARHCTKFGAAVLFANKRISPELKKYLITLHTDDFLFDEYITGNIVLGFLQFRQKAEAQQRLARSFIPSISYMELMSRLAEEEGNFTQAAGWWARSLFFHPAHATAYWKLREFSVSHPEINLAQWDLGPEKIDKNLSRLLYTNYKINLRGTKLYGTLHPHWQPTLLQATTELCAFLLKTNKHDEAFSIAEESVRLIGSDPAFAGIYAELRKYYENKPQPSRLSICLNRINKMSNR